jgi:hypothetical protein
MFLHLGNFTKQMKAAYKNGKLDIGMLNNGLFLSSGHWLAWIEEKRVPNKIKAMIMELAGTMPEHKQLFTVSKEYPNPQMKIFDDAYKLMLFRQADAVNKLIVTPLELFEHNPITLLQNLQGRAYGIRSDWFGMIDSQAIDYDAGEGMPTGPCYGLTINQGIYWYNDFGTVVVMGTPVSPKKQALMDILEFVQFKEDGSVEKKFRKVGEQPEETDEPDQATDEADTEG